jgi:hypothetical protein
MFGEESLMKDREEEDWDVMEPEEVEVMKVFSSAVNVNVKGIDEVDLEQYPIPSLCHQKLRIA